MRYTVLPSLWQRLAEEERGLRWLARKAGVDNSVLSLVRSGLRKTVNQKYAERIAAVFDVPVSDFFVPVTASELTEKVSYTGREVAA